MSTREFTDLFLQIFHRKTELCKDGFHFRFPMVTASCFKCLLYLCITAQNLFTGICKHCFLKLVHLILQIKYITIDQLQLFFHRPIVMFEYFLCQIPDGDTTLNGNITAIKGLFPAHTSQKCCLTTTVPSDQCNLFRAFYFKCHIFKYRISAEVFGCF